MTVSLGPWITLEKQGTPYNVADSDGSDVALCLGKSPAQRIRNASLVAAAPELLSACKEALGAFENNNAIDWNDLVRAIEKAEGR